MAFGSWFKNIVKGRVNVKEMGWQRGKRRTKQ